MTPGNRQMSALGADIRAVIERMRANALDAVEDGAEYYTKAVGAKAPVLTGAYKGSLRCERIGDHTIGCGSPQPYMMRLEYGFVGTDSAGRVHNQAAQPHWRPVFDAEKDRIRTTIERSMRARLKEAR